MFNQTRFSRKLWSLAAVAVSLGVFLLLGYDLTDGKILTYAILAGLGLYLVGLIVVWAVMRARGD